MRRFNLRQFIWFLILASFSVYIICLLTTGQIYIFINPKLIKYTVLSLVMLIILTIYQIKNIFMISKNNGLKFGYILFLVPLILVFFAKGLDTSIINGKSVSVSSSANRSQNGEFDKIRKYYINNGVVVFDDIFYYRILNDINLNLNFYKDKEIKINGFIYKDNSFKNNEFVLARRMMVCCAVDTQVVGLMCNYDRTADFNNDQWVSIEGKIKIEKLKDSGSGNYEDMPVIIVKKISKINNGNEYIYP